MAAKIIKLVCELIVFACMLWRFSNLWQFYQMQYLDKTTIVFQVIIIMLSAALLTATMVQIFREIRQMRREKEENRIGPDL